MGSQTPLFSLAFLFLFLFPYEKASAHYYFAIKEAPYRRLCERKKILTVNGEFPGPTIRVHKGQTIYVKVHNKAKYNITIHWHGVKQPRYPWSDGPEYITQCPIQPGAIFKQKLIFSEEEGTLWWHAHSTWSRATVHGAIIIYPNSNHSSPYPFPNPSHQVPIILGEWWKKDVREIYERLVEIGGDSIASDALTINGQPGGLFPCSTSEAFKLVVDQGSSYLLRIVNAAMNAIIFLSIADHNLTVVGIDGSYTKPLTTPYIVIAPGQTLDALLLADRPPDHYYIAARAFSSRPNIISFNNTTTTAIVQYTNTNNPILLLSHHRPLPRPRTRLLPYLPFFNDTAAAFGFFTSLRSFVDPANVPKHITTRIISTISINILPCSNGRCEGPNGSRFAASMNNISFISPSSINILKAYYSNIQGVYDKGFPERPPREFNYTAEDVRVDWEVAERGRKVKVLEYGSTVEMVLQGTSLVGATEHPMHVHGHSFYVVGFGFGNFDEPKHTHSYNLVDPPLRNTVTVPANGWITLRFWANNPGVWYMHCHLERHLTWGMNMVFIVKNGKTPQTKLLPPPPDMPPC